MTEHKRKGSKILDADSHSFRARGWPDHPLSARALPTPRTKTGFETRAAAKPSTAAWSYATTWRRAFSCNSCAQISEHASSRHETTKRTAGQSIFRPSIFRLIRFSGGAREQKSTKSGNSPAWRNVPVEEALRDKPRGAVQLCSKSKRSQYFRFFRTRFFKICYLCDVCKSWKLVRVHWVRKVGYVWKISLHAGLQFSWATFSFQSLRLKRTQN